MSIDASTRRAKRADGDARSRAPWSAASAVALHSATLIMYLAASSAPTPLYRLYQQAWGFDATVLTAVFASYSLALLLALLLTGRLSDYLGRRPVIAFAVLLQMIAMSCFLLAQSPASLIVARVVQGAATGIATAAIGAALLDLGRERGALINSVAPMVGMACGALGSTAMMVFVPWPLRAVYVLLLVFFAAVLGLVWLTPETAPRRAGALASLRPRIVVPPQARRTLLAVTPANVAVWMLGGFYLSMMPSLIVAATGVRTPWLSAFVVAALTLTGALAVFAARGLATRSTLLSGEFALTVGLLVILFGANRGNAALLLIGSLVAGFGFGATFLGAVRSVLPLAEPHERAALMGAFYIESYLANGLPTMAAGYLAQRTSLLTAVNAYGAVILFLIALAIALLYLRARAPVGRREQA